MESFTYASDEACEAVIANLPFKYPMDLTRSDMEFLIVALQVAWENGNEWAGDFLSSIATTCDVEFV